MAEEQIIHDIPLCYYEYSLLANNGDSIPPSTGNIFYASATHNYIIKEWEAHLKRNRHKFSTYKLHSVDKRATIKQLVILCKEDC